MIHSSVILMAPCAPPPLKLVLSSATILESSSTLLHTIWVIDTQVFIVEAIALHQGIIVALEQNITTLHIKDHNLLIINQ